MNVEAHGDDSSRRRRRARGAGWPARDLDGRSPPAVAPIARHAPAPIEVQRRRARRRDRAPARAAASDDAAAAAGAQSVSVLATARAARGSRRRSRRAGRRRRRRRRRLPPPPLKLVGIAEDPTPTAPVRTAIISGDRPAVPRRRKATRSPIATASRRSRADGVELIDLSDGSTTQADAVAISSNLDSEFESCRFRIA